MPKRHPIPLAPLLGLLLAFAACAGRGGAAGAPPPEYAALADTAVCVVDRTSPTGLRDIPAKKAADGDVLLRVGDRVQTLEEVHPVALLAGYAGNERWLTSGEPIVQGAVRYLPYQGQRRVPIDQLTRVGEHQAIPLFAPHGESAPYRTVYVPTRPGCVFQPYVRSDLLQR